MQVNCVMDLRIYCLPLSLVVPRRYTEGQFAVCVFRVAGFHRVKLVLS